MRPIGITRQQTREFESFFNAERRTIGAALALTLGDQALGFEAVDEAMTRAYERWATVSELDNPSGWVYRTGLNWATSFLRRRKRSQYKDYLAAKPELGAELPPNVDLLRAMDALDDDHRAVVVLRYYFAWSVRETATALGVAEGTVKSRLSRALERLRQDQNLKQRSVG